MTRPTDIPIVLINERDPFNMGFRRFVREDDSQLEGMYLKLHASGLLLEQRFYHIGRQHGIWFSHFKNGILLNRTRLKKDGSLTGYYIGRKVDDTLSSAYKED